MAEEPDNLVLVQLREIRAKLDKLDKIEADEPLAKLFRLSRSVERLLPRQDGLLIQGSL